MKLYTVTVYACAALIWCIICAPVVPIGHETSAVPGTVTCIFDKYEVTTLIQLKSPFINNTLTYCITQNIFVQESYSLPIFSVLRF